MSDQEIKTTPNPKLSALIAQGSRMTKKATGAFFWWKDNQGYACALGAALIAHVGSYENSPKGDVCEHLGSALGYNPAYENIVLTEDEVKGFYPGTYSVSQVVIYLNDEAKWTRPRIAALLKRHGL